MPQTAPSATDLQLASPEHAIVFAEGLVGCQTWKRFFLMVDDEDEELPVAVLQSLDDPNVRLLVTDPVLIDPSYTAHLAPQDLAGLGLEEGIKPVLFCTLSISDDGWLTANLLGPLVMNPITRQAKQIVQLDSTYMTRHPVAQLSSEGGSACSS